MAVVGKENWSRSFYVEIKICHEGKKTRELERKIFRRLGMYKFMCFFFRAGPANWGKWSNWTACSLSCGEGIRQRFRECDNPPPAYGKPGCQGPAVQSETCENTPCPGMLILIIWLVYIIRVWYFAIVPN